MSGEFIFSNSLQLYVIYSILYYVLNTDFSCFHSISIFLVVIIVLYNTIPICILYNTFRADTFQFLYIFILLTYLLYIVICSVNDIITSLQYLQLLFRSYQCFVHHFHNLSCDSNN